MMRKTPMKRTGFKRKENQPIPLEKAESVAINPVAIPIKKRVIQQTANDRVFAIPKECAIQHEGYMRLVRLLPCAMCGIEGHTQFCHADEGKGIGTKTDCRRGWPGCGPRPGIPGCHYLVGTSGTIPREERRALEARLGAQTRAKILELGLWPKTLLPWVKDSHPP